jgi:hypothetical protein
MPSSNPITRCTVHLSKLPLPRLIALFALLVVVPVVSLAYLSITRAGDTVQEDARTRVQDLATLAAQGVDREMAGVEALVESYAQRREERLADAPPLVAEITAAFPASLELLQREYTAVAQS